MSNLIALKENGKCYIATCPLVCDNQEMQALDSNLPIWRPKGCKDTVLCGAGKANLIMALRYQLGFIEEDENGEMNDKYISTELVHNVFDILNHYSYVPRKDNEWKAQLVIGRKDRLYLIDADYACVEIEDYFTTYKMDTAVDTVFDFTKGEDPIYRICLAFFINNEYYSGLICPLIIENVTDHKRYKLYRKDILRIIKNKGLKKVK